MIYKGMWWAPMGGPLGWPIVMGVWEYGSGCGPDTPLHLGLLLEDIYSNSRLRPLSLTRTRP
ncbi:hypothetical protein ACRALDRAFT_2061061 [Sodiomyces alcalophilus JCM 7366]|uniref:uncharacterized protein n=1 Tax=Sodiomyces alcalophilus JCM 7366 TaxID=591952 RepID=UPI0039B66EA2